MTKLADVSIGVIGYPWPRGSTPGNFRIQVFGADGATELLKVEQAQPHLEIIDDPKFVPGAVINVRVVRLSADGQEVGPVITTASTVPALPQADVPQSVNVTFS